MITDKDRLDMQMVLHVIYGSTRCKKAPKKHHCADPKSYSKNGRVAVCLHCEGGIRRSHTKSNAWYDRGSPKTHEAPR